MSDRQNWSGLGEQFKGALADALQSGDFTQLNDLVTGTVVNTLNEVGISFTQGADPPPEGREYSGASSKEAAGGAFPPFEKEKLRQQKLQHDWQRHMQRRQEEQLRRRQEQMRRQEEQLRRGKAQMQRQKEALMRGQSQLKDKLGNLSLIKFKKVGNVSNVLYQVFGGIGLGITSFITLIRIGAVFLGNTLLSPAGWIVNLIFLAIFGGMVRLGTSQGKRLRRARRYMQLCGDKMYGEIEHLAASIGKSTRYVTRDIQKMLSLGMFPEGHLDTKKTCFMLNDNVYRQYLETEENRRKREAESRAADKGEFSGQAERAQNAKAPQTTGEYHTQDASSNADGQVSELNAMVSEGMECIRKLRELNDKIPGEVISGKLSRLETLLKEIFESVRQHPEQMSRMHKLMDYYLPTTLKLVETYAEFDKISSPGEEILAAKAEIENTLDTINQAFTELLNNLFQDAVFDATTDAQVLKTMLAREGLMNEMEMKAGGMK
ncbi:5-bromo-4-chloroindolyl phosphate hydrolysis family protein [Lachnospiraceae bacterium 54-11]